MWGSEGVTIRQYLIRSVNVLNLVLLAVAVVVFFYLLDPILQEPAAVAIPPAKEESALPVVPAKGTGGVPLTTADYDIIGDKNLFHPDRVIPPEKKKVDTAKEKAKPELVLHGTMITDQVKLAYIEDKKAHGISPGRGAGQSTLKEGDQIGGYKLTQITDKMIVLTNSSEQMILYLDELKERKTETTMTAKPSGATQPMFPQTAQGTPRPLPTSVSTQKPVNTAAPSRRINQPAGQGARPESTREPTMLPPPFPPPIPGSPAKTN